MTQPPLGDEKQFAKSHRANRGQSWTWSPATKSRAPSSSSYLPSVCLHAVNNTGQGCNLNLVQSVGIQVDLLGCRTRKRVIPNHLTTPKLSSVLLVLFLLLSHRDLTDGGPYSEDTYGLSMGVRYAAQNSQRSPRSPQMVPSPPKKE